MPENGRQRPLIYLVAGETSGDNLGAGLIDGIRSINPDAGFVGIGGPAMHEAGMTSLFPMSDLSVMGLAEVLPRLRLLLGRIRETVTHIKETRPDVVVTIDSPDFCFRVAGQLQGFGIPLVHYVAPTVWAWRPKRAAKIARLYDHLLTLFPFEPPYFEVEGLPATFVGHPLAGSDLSNGDAGRFLQVQEVPARAPVLCLLPGSRDAEVSRLLPVFLQTLKLLRRDFPDLYAVCPTVPHLVDTVRNLLSGVANVSVVSSSRDKKDAYAASTAALAASGTVALELGLARVPAVIGYMMSPLTAIIARHLVRLPNVSLVNILLNRDVMPEFMQEQCTSENLAPALCKLLKRGPVYQSQLSAFDEVREKLVSPRGSPNELAAKAVLKLVDLRGVD